MPISQNGMVKLFSMSAVRATARLQSVVTSFYSVKTAVITAAAASNVAADMQHLDMHWQSHLVYHYHAKQLDFHSMSLHCLHKLSSKQVLLVFSAPRHDGAAAQHVIAPSVSVEQ